MNPSSIAEGLLNGLSGTARYLSAHRTFTAIGISLLAFAMLALDLASPPYIEFSVVYTFLIAAGAHFASWRFGLALAAIVPASHLLLYVLIGNRHFPPAAELLNVLLLFVAGLAAVYLLRLARRMEELRQANLRLETLQQTMVTVNDIVLNRLQVMQFMIHLAEQGRPLAPEQIQLGKGALEEVAIKLRDLSQLSHYETTEVTSGVRAVRVPDGMPSTDPTADPA